MVSFLSNGRSWRKNPWDKHRLLRRLKVFNGFRMNHDYNYIKSITFLVRCETVRFREGMYNMTYIIYLYRECIMSLPFYQETTQPAVRPAFCRCTKAKTPAIAMMIGLAVGGLHTVAGSTAATATSEKRFQLHPRNSTWNLKISPWKRKVHLETIIFRFHVKFRGCKSWLASFCNGVWYITQEPSAHSSSS